MKPPTAGLDARKNMEVERRLARAMHELTSLLQTQEETAALLVEVVALAREVVQARGDQEGIRRIMRQCPQLVETTARFQDLARQVSVTIDDLQALMSPL